MILCYVLNKVPKCNSNLYPYEILKNKEPNVSYLPVWGCLTYVRFPDPERSKLASRVYECVLLVMQLISRYIDFMIRKIMLLLIE